jgi:hypothetical protein
MLHSVNQSEDLVVTSPHKIEPYPFGLFSVASVSEYSEAQDSWARYTAHEYNSKAFRGTNLSTRDATAYTLSDTIGSPRFLEYIPFGIEIEDYASTLGINAQDRFKRSLDILEGISQKALERELWEGDCAKIGNGAIGGAYSAGTVAATYASNVITITITGGTSLLKDGDLVHVTGLTYTGATGATAGPFVVSGSTTVGGSTIKYAAPTATSAITGAAVVTAPHANNYLTKSGSSTNLTVTTAGDNPRLALANLENNLSLCPLGQRGTIHMSHKTASILTGVGLLERIDFSARLDKGDVNNEKQALVTLLGTPVIVGAGYTGNGPTNIATAPATAAAEWMFATGLVDAHLGASRVINEDLARAVAPNTNDAHIRAARTAAVHFEPCCHYAVRVDLSTINNF